ncbi:MAG: glutamate-cysteine ligase family protein [Gammaproteobacteria bacterium]|nr:glutamate-cysteine ligase family protein [Gammaproteobacteria bacterium]
MGQEIERSHFRKQDFLGFEARLRQETRLLQQYFETQRFADEPLVGGFELEVWLMDRACQASPRNEEFLAALNSDKVFPELARFNVELNGDPQRLSGKALSKMHQELRQTWKQCTQTADKLAIDLIAVGILPTLKEQQLVLANMSPMTRYRALNEQVRRMRQGNPLKLDIQGVEQLKTYHEDVMMESAATSFQLHLQVPQRLAAPALNIATILSAPMVAVSANSPFLFGHDLWDETRIPVFEQAVSVCLTEVCLDARVTFGNGYAKHTLMELFNENLERYAVLLPETLDPDPASFSHLRLHNGTIWRWNRPLVGFESDGTPHLRIEHRVMAAGPSLIDTTANAAFFYGLMQMMLQLNPPAETQLHFSEARRNFYRAAQKGLRSHIRWLNGNEVAMTTLLLEQLLPLARQGLEQLEIDRHDRETYLELIEARVRTQQNGSAWQRAYAKQHGRNMQQLTAAYLENQKSGKPVHEWKL